jgi:hypothetical protein
MNYEDELEEMMYAWLIMLPEDEQRGITHWQAIDAAINEEAEEEMKEEIWRLLKNNLNYRAILQRLKIHLDEVIETQEEEEEEEVSDQASTD